MSEPVSFKAELSSAPDFMPFRVQTKLMPSGRNKVAEHERSFWGVGEACDPERFNTSLLVLSGSKNHYILLDCGFTTPHRYFADCSEPNQLDALWISHFHGDNFFGVPLLLLRFWEMGRTRPLLSVGPPGLAEKVAQAVDLAYPCFVAPLVIGYGIVAPFLQNAYYARVCRATSKFSR